MLFGAVLLDVAVLLGMAVLLEVVAVLLVMAGHGCVLDVLIINVENTMHVFVRLLAEAELVAHTRACRPWHP